MTESLERLVTHRRGVAASRTKTRSRAFLVRGSRLATLAVALASVIALVLVAPEAAHADPITDAITDGIKGALDWVFVEIIGWLFGAPQTKIGELFGQWLTGIPNFSEGEVPVGAGGAAKSHIDQLRQDTTMLALGGLTAVVTLTVIRYWISGLSMSGAGGIEALEGFGRSLLAVAMIMLWPEFFRLTIALANSATTGLLGLPGVQENFRGLWGTVTLGVGASLLNPASAPVGVIVTIVIATATMLMFLALAVMKIFITAATAFLFVAMPIMLVLWPLPETAWLARLGGRAFVVCLTVPLTWALVFTTFGALGADFLSFKGQGGILELAIIKPLATIAMLWLAITIPRTLGKAAILAAITPNAPPRSSGFLGHMASYLVARRLDAALTERFPGLQGQLANLIPGGGGRGGQGGQAGNGAGDPGGRGPGGRPGGERGGGGGGSEEALAANLPNVGDPEARARGQALHRADAAFGTHGRDDERMQASRQRARGQLAQWRENAKKGTPEQRANYLARTQAVAQDAASRFSPEQQTALRGVLDDGGIETFAYYTSHLSYSPNLSEGQQRAAQVLSAMPRSVLNDILPPSTGGTSSPQPGTGTPSGQGSSVNGGSGTSGGSPSPSAPTAGGSGSSSGGSNAGSGSTGGSNSGSGGGTTGSNGSGGPTTGGPHQGGSRPTTPPNPSGSQSPPVTPQPPPTNP